MLCKEFTEKEISDALFQIGPLKAPGPDGFPARFFQRNWGLLKEDMVRAVKRFFSDGVMPDEVNDTNIVLIPKTSKVARANSAVSLISAIIVICT